MTARNAITRWCLPLLAVIAVGSAIWLWFGHKETEQVLSSEKADQQEKAAPLQASRQALEPGQEADFTRVSISVREAYLRGSTMGERPAEPEKFDGNIIDEYGSFVRIQHVYRNCRDTTRGFQCDTVTEYDHPYNAFSHDELVSIAEFDAEASFILAHRLFYGGDYKKYYGDRWYEAGVNFYIDATILSGHSEPYRRMLSARGLRGIRHDNGKLAISHLEDTYAWRKAGIALGYLSNDDISFNAVLKFVEDNRALYPEIEIDRWDLKAHNIRRMIEQRKAAITG